MKLMRILVVIILCLSFCLPAAGFAGSGTFKGEWWHYYDRGLEYAEKGDLENGISDLKEAMALRSKDKRRARTYGMHFIEYFPHREIGIIYFNMGDLTRAFKELEESIRSEESAKAIFYLNKTRQAVLQKQKDKTVAKPPVITVESPAPNAVVKELAIRVRGRVAGEGFVSSVSINKAPYRFEKAQEEIVFEKEIAVDDGANTVVVTAKDLMGNISEKSVTINVKREGPTIVIFDMSEEKDRDAFVRVKGEVSDTSGIKKILLDGRELATGGKKAFKLDLLIERKPSKEKFLVQAFDLLDNVTTAEVSFPVPDQTLIAAKQAEERLARERAEKLAREKAEQERLTEVKAAAERAERDRLAKEAIERADRLVKELLEQERIAKEKGIAEKTEKARIAKERAEAERLSLEKEETARKERERLAGEKAELEKAIAAKAAAEKLAQENAEAERLAKVKAEQERLAAEKANTERIEREKAEAVRLAKEKVEQERFAAERAAAYKEASERLLTSAISTTSATASSTAQATEKPTEQKTVTVVEREKLQQVFDEQKASEALIIDPSKKVKLGRISGGEGTKAYEAQPVTASKGPVEIKSPASVVEKPAADEDLPEKCKGLFAFDREKPVLALRGAGDIPEVFVDRYPVEGEAFDNCRIDRVVVNDREVPVRKGNKIFFSKNVKLNAGQNRIAVDVYDHSGNKASTEFNVTRNVPSVMRTASRMSMLVLPFDAKENSGDLAPIANDYLMGSFVEQKRFAIVDRQKLRQMLDEQQFTQAMIKDLEKQIKLGQLTKAETILATTIKENQKSVEVVSRVINTETSEIMDIKDGYAEDKSPLAVKELMDALASKIAGGFPLIEGIVIDRNSREVVTDLGSLSRIKKNMGAIIYRKGKERIHPVTGVSLGCDIIKLCEGYIEDIQEGYSKIRLSDKARQDEVNIKDFIMTK